MTPTLATSYNLDRTRGATTMAYSV